MHVTLIQPRISGKHQEVYIRNFPYEPHTIATVAGLLPDDVEITFFDDRIEEIDFDDPTDLVGITAETYTAKRAYVIASEFRKRGVPVVLGGWHPTLLPDEAEQYADAIVIGEAENVMEELLEDFKNNRLKKRYESSEPADLDRIKPRRDIFAEKNYPAIGIVEFGRGCKFRCDFCCIHKFYKGSYRTRTVEAVLKEIEALPHEHFIFADDNVVNKPELTKPLLRGMVPLHKKWTGHGCVDAARDDELLTLLQKSGCFGLFIGFESSNDVSLSEMKKGFRKKEYETAIRKFRSHGLSIEGSFLWGYDHDNLESCKADLEFAIQKRFLIAGFNFLVPYPGTELYARLKKEGRLLYENWWLDQEEYFGSVAYQPKNFTPDELTRLFYDARREFNHPLTVLRRNFDFGANMRNFIRIFRLLMGHYKPYKVTPQDEENALPSRLSGGKGTLF